MLTGYEKIRFESDLKAAGLTEDGEDEMIAAVSTRAFAAYTKNMYSVVDPTTIDEIWYLTTDADEILDCEDPIYVSTIEDLIDELKIRSFTDEGLNSVHQNYIKTDQNHGIKLSNGHVPNLTHADVSFFKSLDRRYGGLSKPVVAIHSTPTLSTGDWDMITELLKKHGRVRFDNSSARFGTDKYGNPKSVHSFAESLGMKSYVGDDITIEEHAFLVWTPGAKPKHEKRLNSSRKRRVKKHGKIPMDEVLYPIHEIITKDFDRVVLETIGLKMAPHCTIEVTVTKSAKRTVLMGVIADRIRTINNLTDEVEYRKGELSRWCYNDNEPFSTMVSYTDYLKKVKPSLASLLKSKEPDEKNFAQIMKIECDALLK